MLQIRFYVFTGLKLRKMFIIGQRNNTLEIFLHSCTLCLLPRGSLMVGGWKRDLQQRETEFSVGTTERSVSRNGFFYLPQMVFRPHDTDFSTWQHEVVALAECVCPLTRAAVQSRPHRACGQTCSLRFRNGILA